MHADCNIFLFSLPLSFCHKNFAKVKLRLGVRFDLANVHHKRDHKDFMLYSEKK